MTERIQIRLRRLDLKVFSLYLAGNRRGVPLTTTSDMFVYSIFHFVSLRTLEAHEPEHQDN